MKNGITIIYFLLIFLSCKQKQTEQYINTENNSEIVEIKNSEAKKTTESKEEYIIPDCDLKTLVAINSHLENGIELNDQIFYEFFENMNPECSNNIEYIEFNNEMIFKTLESNPEKFVGILSRISKKKGILEFVLSQLQNPISDGIDFNEISRVLGKTKTEDSKTQALVSESINIAIEKFK